MFCWHRWFTVAAHRHTSALSFFVLQPVYKNKWTLDQQCLKCRKTRRKTTTRGPHEG